MARIFLQAALILLERLRSKSENGKRACHKHFAVANQNVCCLPLPHLMVGIWLLAVQDTDTVKKFISTILPHEREDLVTSPFPPGTHLITTLAGSPLDPPSPNLVVETEPSSIIHYLHTSEPYRQFIAGSGSRLDGFFLQDHTSDHRSKG